MNSIGQPGPRWTSLTRLSMAPCTDTSRAEVISSAITTSGLAASARASATRCRWPPDSVPGGTVRHRPGRGRPVPAGARSPTCARIGSGRPSSPRRRWRRRSSGGRARRTDPGTPSGPGGRGPWSERPRRRAGCGRRTAAPARPPPWPGTTCRSRTRRPGPTICAVTDVQVDVVDRMQAATAPAERDRDVLEVQRAHAGHPPRCGPLQARRPRPPAASRPTGPDCGC